MIKIAIYGKGEALESQQLPQTWRQPLQFWEKRVIQIGCDPKADSTINLLGGIPVVPVMNYLRDSDTEPEHIEDIARKALKVFSV